MSVSSFSQSKLEEGSSRIRISVLRSSALQRAIRCRCPPDRCIPPSPTSVSYPLVMLMINSCENANLATSSICSRVALGTP
mmetsp:Transcript_29372/g.49581  ORF Transcript_29372/g.49581 Transcript_29372/m.49581 type:complete len:81 (-) Transcript_29372:1694-1936(-)